MTSTRKPIPTGSPALWRPNSPITLLNSNLNTMGRLSRAERMARQARRGGNGPARRKALGWPQKRKWLAHLQRVARRIMRWFS